MSEQNNGVSSFEEAKKKALEYIEEITAKADEIQRRVLSEILTQNAGVEYLRRHGLSGDCNADREAFKKAIPVVSFEDILPYMKRIADGDTSPILCSKPILLVASSGTSRGERKLSPSLEDELERTSNVSRLRTLIMSQYMPGIEKGKGMNLSFIRPSTTTPGGLPVDTFTSRVFKSKPFKDYTCKNSTSPVEAILCPDPFQSMYSQMLCGLLQNRDVNRVGATFATGLARAVKFLERHWRDLAHDIRTGSLDPQVTDPDVRGAVLRILRPDPGLAGFIESECGKDSWKGIITRLWPNAKYIETISTGAMAQHIPTLDYYSNGLPLVSPYYGSSECFFGLNLNPICEPSEATYTIFPTMAYFEFLPVSRDGDEAAEGAGELVDLVDVRLGRAYEIVVTTYSGLYRYRVGDILRVAGFKNKAPQFSFVGRKNVVLSVDAEKTDEVELHNAVTRAARSLAPHGVSLSEYTSYPDVSTTPGHYVLFWELIDKEEKDKKCSVVDTIPTSVLEQCCLAVEESLSTVYRNMRVSNREIGPLEIRVVEGGTFDELMDYTVNKVGVSMSQYKTPKSVKSAEMLQLLESRVVSRHFSPKSPQWVPVDKLSCTEEEDMAEEAC